MRVHLLDDTDQIRAYLETDRLWAAYALGDLEPAPRALCDWYGAEDAGGLRALALLYRGFHPPVLFTMGDRTGVALMLGSAMRAPDVYLNAREEHMPAIRAHYGVDAPELMWRMTLKPEELRVVPGSVKHLTPQFTTDLYRMYALGGGDSFTPSQVFAGSFFGVEEHGVLIAAAGTHVLSEAYDTAAIGNVFTHPDHRGRGCASRATSAVCSDLIRRGIRTIVLNVSRSNHAAIHVYEKLGFRKHLPFIEGRAVRKMTR